MASSQFNIRETWTTLYTGNTTSGNAINVPNVTSYKEICLIGYIGTDSGGKRFNVLASTKQTLALDYSVFLTPTQSGQLNIRNNDSIILAAPDAHVTAVYGVK